MARVKGPLFSLSASGSFKDMIEFRTSGGSTIAVGTKSRVPPRSPAQTRQNQRFSTALSAWKLLTSSQRQQWVTAAVPTGLTGYQLYLHEYIIQNVTPPGQPTRP